MDQYQALFWGFIVFFFSTILILWMTRHTPSQETFDELLKEREEKLEIPVGTKKDRRRKSKKEKVIQGERKKGEKRDSQESARTEADVNGDDNVSQPISKPSALKADDVQKLQHSGRSLDSGTLHQRKANGESKFSHAKNDADNLVRSVERVSGKSAEPKVISKFGNHSDGSDKRGRMEELDEIYPIEVGNWSYATDNGTSCQSTEHSFVTDGRKKPWLESTFRGLDAASKNNVTQCISKIHF